MNDDFFPFGVAQVLPPGEFGSAILNDHNCRVVDGANGDAQAGEREKIDRLAESRHRQNREQDAEKKDGDRPCCRTDIPEKQNGDQRHNNQFGYQGREKLLKRRPDPCGAVVRRNDLHAGRQRAADLLQFLVKRLRDRKDVLVLRHDHNAADNLSSAVEIDGAAALIITNLEVADIPDVDGVPIFVAPDNEVFQFVDVAIVDGSAQLVIPVRNLDHSSAGFLKHFLDGRHHLAQRNACICEQRRKDFDLKLLFESADGRHFGNARHRLQRGLDLAFIDDAQLAQVMRTFPINQGILIDPADAAGVGSKCYGGIGRKLRPDDVDPVRHELLNPRPISPIAQNDVDERVPHVGGTSYRLDVGRSSQCGDKGLSDLRLQQLRTARPFGINDDLGI